MNRTILVAGSLLCQLLTAPALAADHWFLRPYVGLSQMSDLDTDFADIDGLSGEADVGLTWAEEIDIDLERNGEEESYSGDGDVGYQLFAGVNYALNEAWQLQSELRYGSITDIDLKGESSDPGEITGIDYEITTLQIGVVYAF